LELVVAEAYKKSEYTSSGTEISCLIPHGSLRLGGHEILSLSVAEQLYGGNRLNLWQISLHPKILPRYPEKTLRSRFSRSRTFFSE